MSSDVHSNTVLAKVCFIKISEDHIHKSLSVLSVSPFDDKETASECSKMGYQGAHSLLWPELGFKASSFNLGSG